MKVELHPEVAKNLLKYLENAMKRSEYIINNKSKYNKEAVENAERVYSLLSVVCNNLRNAINLVQTEETKEEKPKEDTKQLEQKIIELENKVKELQQKLEMDELILKKLKAYHTGEI